VLDEWVAADPAIWNRVQARVSAASPKPKEGAGGSAAAAGAGVGGATEPSAEEAAAAARNALIRVEAGEVSIAVKTARETRRLRDRCVVLPMRARVLLAGSGGWHVLCLAVLCLPVRCDAVLCYALLCCCYLAVLCGAARRARACVSYRALGLCASRLML
jgi:hypothetical protein